MKVRDVLNQIVDLFKSGDVPQAISIAKNPSVRLPSDNWSLLNRMLMFCGGTRDARGYRQWEQAKRHVKKGSHAIYILAPLLKKQKKENNTEDYFLIGFKAVPVFRLEDTEGEPLAYEVIELSKLPLMERAMEWGLDVRFIPANDCYFGSFSQAANKIELATAEETVFFHELTHAGHSRIKNGLKPGQDPFQEIVAELGAAALCRLVGKEPDKTLGNSYRYIERYAIQNQPPMTPITACLQVLSEVEQVLNLILKGGDDGRQEETAPALAKGVSIG